MSGDFVPDLSWQDASPAARDPYYGLQAPCPECGHEHESGECVTCLDAGPDGDGCEGPVEYRMPLSGTGRSFPRCEKHWDERLDRQEQIRERYFGTPSSHYCRHGNYIGDPYGADYICGACENGD